MHPGITQKISPTPIKQKKGKQFWLMLIVLLAGFSAFAQPANDDPCSAVSLPVTSTCVSTPGTTVDATSTTGVSDPDCASYDGGDVWFSFVVPSGGSVTLNSTAGTLTDGGMEVYSGTCTSLTSIDCDDDSGPGLMPKIVLNGLTPGATIWVRFWEYDNDDPGTFDICVTLPPPPPTNISPCTATEMVAGQTCNFATFSNLNAPGFPGAPEPGCAGYEGSDVWFKVTVPCGGGLKFDTQEGDITDGGMAIYSGTCDNLTLLDCNDDDSPGGGLMPYLTASNLTPGSIVWVRVWEYGNDNNGTFGLCVSIPAPPSPNGICSTALPFCTSNVYTFPNSVDQPSIGSNGIYGCLDETPNPVWYYMQVQSPGDITIGIHQEDFDGIPIDVDFALWGPFPSLNASCGGLTEDNNISCSYSPDADETAQINNAQVGEFYIMLLTNYENAAGTITFQQTGGAGTSNCDIVCTLTAGNSGPVCGGSTVNLTSSTVAGGTYVWTGPNCFSSTEQNPTNVQVPTEAGTYVYTVVSTTPSGSSCIATTTVTVSASPALGADKTVITCSGSTVNLTTQFTTTGLTTAWTIGGVAVANPAAVATSGIYQLIGTNAGGCKDTALVNVTIDVVNAAVASVNANCISNGTITVSTPTSGIAPFTYNINTNPGVFQAANTFSAPQGNYTIIVKDAQGCTVSKPIAVAFTNDLSITGSQDLVICNGQSAVLTTTSTSADATYSWSPSTGLSSSTVLSPTANPSQTTLYTLTATLGTCTKTDDVLVTVQAGINVNAGPDVTLISGDKGVLTASVDGPVTSILWSPTTALNPTNALITSVGPLTTQGTFTYTITVKNALGCTSSDDALVTVIPYCIKVKNAFTPNGDGNNDLWQVYDGYECLKNVTVHIFNRYGSKVYESRDYRNTWDGRYDGKSLPDATYYAVIDFTLINGKVVTIKTDLTILR